MDEVQLKELQERLSSLEQESKNKAIALKEEREKRKTMEEELEGFRDAERKAQEKKAKEKGKYEELLDQYKKENDELKEKANSWDKYLIDKQETVTSKWNDLEAQIPEDVRTKYSSIVDGLDTEKKIDFFSKIIEDSKPADFGKQPEGTVQKPESGFVKKTSDEFQRLSRESRKQYMSDSVEQFGEVVFDA